MTWDWLLSIADSRRKKKYEKDCDTFLALLAPKKDDRILDVGAGLGTIANLLCAFSDEVFALDPDERKVDYVKKKHPQVKMFSATANQVPFPSGYFDKLYVVAAFHHFQDQDDALEEFRRVIKVGGALLIHELDPSEGSGKRLHFFETKLLRNDAHFLQKDGLKSLLGEHGFSVTEERAATRGYYVLARNEMSD